MIPEGIHIVTLPPYSPELNPIEKLWDLIQDQTANKLWPTIERLDTVVGLHLKDWWEAPDKVISLFGKGYSGPLKLLFRTQWFDSVTWNTYSSVQTNRA